MTSLPSYLSQDRYRALVQGQDLPDRTEGAALFADISGFTPLTESLRHTFGARRGAEELTHYLDAIYNTLIAEVERYHGSVVNFAGDAMLCWFDEAEGRATARAVACAMALQQVMPRAAPALAHQVALKVAVTTGVARRLVVGDPDIYRMDNLAGATIARTATAEHVATQGDIIVDRATVERLAGQLTLQAWRGEAERFALIALDPAFQQEVLAFCPPRAPWPLDHAEKLRPWLHGAVYEREVSGLGHFLTELRPTVVIFVRFIGIDYDSAEAEIQLDSFICQTQAIIMRYDGTFLQITIGDKGSYGLIAFGALTTHEDDVRRATRAAIDLHLMAEEWPFLQPLQIGIAQGVMRVGAYGAATRRTYSVMGDEANLGARLMQAAAPGEIWLSERAHAFVARDFNFEARPPLYLKGKAEPQAVFVVQGGAAAPRFQEPPYHLPLVGRQTELTVMKDKLLHAWQGQAQIIGLQGEAGLGKSRLVAEVVQWARQQGFSCYGGAAQSDALYTPYFAWKPLWRGMLGLSPNFALSQQQRHLRNKIKTLLPGRSLAVPVLAPLVDIPLPDNEFTLTLNPQTRKNTLHALLEDYLKVAARTHRILWILEDIHWIDALSYNLLAELSRAITAFPVAIILTYRPSAAPQVSAFHLETLPHFSPITLTEFSPLESQQAVQAKFAQLYPTQTLPPELLQLLLRRAQGNPFYLEELLNYLHGQGLDPHHPATWSQREWPDTLHALILSRLEQLSERSKTTLRVASVIGRLFRADWLTGYYPQLGQLPEIKADLQELHRLDITPLDTPEPELAYLFKHIVTHEVTYETLPYTQRAHLHEQLAHYLETQVALGGLKLPEVLAALAYHYGQSSNKPKQRHYFQQAAAAAQATYAHEAALDYFAKLLPLLTEPAEIMQLHGQWGHVLELRGDMQEAEQHYRAALRLFNHKQATPEMLQAQARNQLALGKLYSALGEYSVALDGLMQARTAWIHLHDPQGEAETLVTLGLVLKNLGRYTEARQHFEAGLALSQTAMAYRGLAILAAIAGENAQARQWEEQGLVWCRQVGDKEGQAAAWLNLATMALLEGEMEQARQGFTESLALFRQIGAKSGQALALTKWGELALHGGQVAQAWALYEESLSLYRQMGEKPGIALALSHLGEVAVWQGDTVTAQVLYQECFTLRQTMGDKRGLAATLGDWANVRLLQGEFAAARRLREESLTLYRQLNDKKGFAWELGELAYVALCQGDYPTAEKGYQTSLAMWRELGDERGEEELLNDLGLLAWCQGDIVAAQAYYQASLAVHVALANELGLLYSLIGLALVAYHQGIVEEAVALLALIETKRAALQLRLNPLEYRLCHEAIATLRLNLGVEAFQVAWAKGQVMTLQEVEGSLIPVILAHMPAAVGRVAPADAL